MLFPCHFIHLISFKPRSNKGKRYLDPLIRVFENLLGAINFQNFWGVCNVESISTFISILGFRVVCATYGRQVQCPEFRLARSKQVVVNRGVRFSRNGNFTGIFLCILHGFVPGKPTDGYYMSSSLPMPVNSLPQKLQNVKLVCQQW